MRATGAPCAQPARHARNGRAMRATGALDSMKDTTRPLRRAQKPGPLRGSRVGDLIGLRSVTHGWQAASGRRSQDRSDADIAG